MYATPWFITIFLYNFEWNIVSRIWDLFFYEGFYFIYTISISFLQIIEEKLLQLNFEEILLFLHLNPKDNNIIDSEKLINIANLWKKDIKKDIDIFEKEYYYKQLLNT